MVQEPLLSVRDGLDLAGVDRGALWVRYFGIGGELSERELWERIQGDELSDLDHECVALVLNELFSELGARTAVVRRSSATWRWPPRCPTPTRPALATSPTERATELRWRSALAARRAAALHRSSARLLETSSNWQRAANVRARAELAERRARSA